MTDVAYQGLPQAELDVLLDLHDRDGGLRPDAVVESAKDPESPLHGHFEWDDTEAARLHRLAQARQLVAKVKVYIVSQPTVETRAFVSIGALNDRTYQRITEVASSEIAVAQIKRGILRDLARIQSKLQRFSEFSDVCRALQEAADGLAS